MDQWLTMTHKTMEDCILIAQNKNAWNKKERREFLTMLPENILVRRTNKNDMGKNATPIANDPSVHKIVELPSSSSLPC